MDVLGPESWFPDFVLCPGGMSAGMRQGAVLLLSGMGGGQRPLHNLHCPSRHKMERSNSVRTPKGTGMKQMVHIREDNKESRDDMHPLPRARAGPFL